LAEAPNSRRDTDNAVHANGAACGEPSPEPDSSHDNNRPPRPLTDPVAAAARGAVIVGAAAAAGATVTGTAAETRATAAEIDERGTTATLDVAAGATTRALLGTAATSPAGADSSRVVTGAVARPAMSDPRRAGARASGTIDAVPAGPSP
jgi:hypothetical protein